MSIAPSRGKVGVVPMEAAIASSGLAFLQGLRDGQHPVPPYAAASGITIADVEHGRVVFEALPSAEFYNPLGTVHGGWISGLLDSAMGCAVHSLLQPGQAYTTVDLSVSFVRAILEKTGIVRCEGKVIHAGGRIATAEGRLWDARGTLLAHGTETCLILKPGTGSGLS
ncbi:MAG: PaaI family thioesterase [Hyphomicrobiaceae bacterium]